MDCNSYSYAPYMLGDYEKRQLLDCEYNDDMEAEMYEYPGPVFSVNAISYDGQLEVAEEFSDRNKAQRLFDFIVENYSDTPPGDELQDFIRDLLYDGRYTNETEEDFPDEG